MSDYEKAMYKSYLKEDQKDGNFVKIDFRASPFEVRGYVKEVRENWFDIYDVDKEELVTKDVSEILYYRLG